MSWGKAQGKAKGGSKGGWQPQQWGIPGLAQSLSDVLGPIADEEPEVQEINKKISQRIQKVSDRFIKDERLTQKLSATNAKALIEEFIEHIMGSISGAYYDKPWASKVSFSQPLLLVVLHTFQSAKIFNRVLKPQIIKYIEDGFNRWQEDARIEQNMQEAISVSGIQEAYVKKANKQIMESYNEAHFNAPYGTTTNDSPELAVLQDFVKGWMKEFCDRAWDVLEHGCPGEASREASISLLAVLFQNLLDPNVACMPHEIASEVANSLGGLPASPWPFIDEAANAVYAESEAQNAPRAKRPRIAAPV